MDFLIGVGGIAVLVAACTMIYLVGHALKRHGRDLTVVLPGYPLSIQGPINQPLEAPGRSYPEDDTSLVVGEGRDPFRTGS